jgi:murein DD-endopeptidase MepM/ murein hydrolase activator NlpD
MPPASAGFCASRPFTPPAESPYVLPYAVGTAHIMFQGNCSALGGHRTAFAYDFDLPMGTTIVASRAGQVTFANDQYADADNVSGHENNVFVTHDDGTVIRYTHLRQGGALVRAGERVTPGQPIGLSGNSGASSGPHLHLQAFRDGTSFDPPNSIPLTFSNADGRTQPSGELIEGERYVARAPGAGR